ncbi:antibiotic biosynthesis monooxygenase [Pseudomonas syringae]|uniref:antibiotic biosynthesis monooxygenase n=1 Tax=Pseudomonas syringae TaxID=317 RepID=UPI0001CC2FE4|nr:antibiotic biosynthesis monooxygenase [Pseudomonas syringae]KEZ74382.1 antibiotic biosynthesis monooxygenase [Pseudomonas syringae pv. syringae FF5]KFF82537.1 antibiotic biosynthesis monooxygenase [Pseudomonas syringae pv. syringae]MBI6711238.1 antibiotic biosynthesis monooxygenase [Pseudomonas syringae]MBI6750511.1 antibiotic biosynthesis monooxygenase [Pseudomonas syringae]MBI6772553.1 antibiotic biosynthesis monooxygenase [Pseudomonas syringae]
MKMELFDAQSVTDDNAVYLINVVQVNEGAQDLAIQILEETVSYVARTYSAFKWSRLMKSTDGKTVINQAQWSDRSQFESLFTDAEFLSRYSRLKETGTWEYHLYNVAEYITPEIALQKAG